LEGGTYEGENVTVVWKCEKCRRYKPIEEFRRSVLWENDDLEPAWICERCQDKEIEAILNTEPHSRYALVQNLYDNGILGHSPECYMLLTLRWLVWQTIADMM